MAKDCDLVCERTGGCEGDTKTYEVSQGSKNWGTFIYCEKAAQADRDMGFTVVERDGG